MSLVYLHTSARATFAASGARIPRTELRGLQSVDTLLRNASMLADSLGVEARERADAVRSAAYEQGLLQGREAALIAILGTLEVERRTLGLLADRIGHVVEQCIRSLIGEVGDGDLFRQRVRHAVRTLSIDGQATLRVAPGQAHLAKEVLRDLEQQSGADLRWMAVHVDERCQQDEFAIETAVGFVDARLTTTLGEARRIIEQAIRRAGEQLPQ
jgi:flagellar biosynthesis/type III secretory pathway protein FliH